MQYVLTFLEGIVTFVSPCLMPMLPIYVGYFMGAEGDAGDRKRVLMRAIGFVAGFTVLFVLMGAFAGTLGSFFVRHAAAVNRIGGAIVVILGLSYLGVFRLPIFQGIKSGVRGGSFLSALVMGAVFAIGWTPCVGAFLGSALVLASQSGSAGEGAALLFIYALGLGIPFVLGAVLMDRLKGLFDFLKRHGETVSRISGALLVLLGVLMMTGLYQKLLA